MTLSEFGRRVRRIQSVASVRCLFKLEDGFTLVVQLGGSSEQWVGEADIVLAAETWLFKQLTTAAATLNATYQ